MKKVVLGLGVSGVALVLAVGGGGCSNEVQVQFGGAGGAQSATSGDVNPVTNSTAHSAVGTSGQSMVTSVTATNNVAVATTGVSNDASSNVAVSSSNVASVSTTNGVAVASVNVSSSSGMGLCAGAPGDSQCTQCAKTDCCAQLTSCFSENGNCDCWALCTQQNPNNPIQCFQQCGQPDQAAIQLGQCTNQSCQAECGGVQPAGSAVASTGVGSSVAASSASGGTPFACQPGFNDNACTTCTKNSCCTDVESCSTNPNCGCWVGCLRQGFTVAQCTQGCGAPDVITNQLFACSSTECPTACN